MSDAEDDATPGARHAALGAAPWERFSEPPSDYSLHLWQTETAVEPTRPRAADDQESGSHAGGAVSVADLIAKLGAPSTGRSTHHRVEPDIEPALEPAEAESDLPVELQETQVIEDLAYSLDVISELPDLEPADHRNGDGSPSDGTPHADQRKTRHRHRPLLLAARSVAALLALLAVAMTGGAWQWSTSKNARLNTINALDPQSDDIRDRNGQYGDEDFLIVGMDSRSGDNANMGAGSTDDAGGARSDTVMLVNIPANRKRVVAVSFPRDLAITPMQCEAWNPETGKYGPLYDAKTKTWGPKMVYTETKLNSAFAFGGPKCLVKEIQKLSGLSINRFIAVDFAGFAKMVDALGGVEVCSKSALHDYELGTVLEHGGRQVLDGPTALNYVRARQVTTETNGDYGRIKRQQLFLSSLLRSLISEDTLLDLNKLNNVVNMFISDTVVDNVQSKDLIQLGQSLQGMAAGHVTFVTVPTGVTDQNGDEPPRMADMRALFDAIINDDPLPEENDQNAKNLGTSDDTSGRTKAPATKQAPAPTAAPEARHEQVTTTTPGDVTVRVSNATTQSGLAATATSQLKRDGFNVMTPDDYPSSVNTTTVLFSPGNEQAAATVASSFANAKVQRVSGYGQVVQVVLGPDFKSVATPQPSGSSISLQIERGSGSAPAKLPEDLTVTNAADTTCE
ncbi:transcriptional regulator [Mycobacterium nebraskense]|uniref:Transcriptional regulator n=2 Tax=Mycobacterium nebraskense TaxID=244292 RepID=A0A1X1ZJ02_9MYCO|nr:LCP family protein [Mycobacterium nebraskense]KLO31310.1 transcriptional regulator [Mycobacterium nebraskense]MCV7118154.1 LCP family protein [Mycobacterium nebraskense]ORW23344.1 transcriptional regulator [Mycobacterium nebraskense]